MSGWGPDGAAMAATVTFDHLGEASEVQSGEWGERPLGRHPSVSETLPRLLDMMAGLGQTTTFYVEAMNCELYPDAVRSISEAGHDLGWHGWFNEPLYKQSRAAFDVNYGRTLAAFDDLGLRLAGCRPAGGLLGEHSMSTFVDTGFDYLSFSGEAYGLIDGVATLPYAWRNIDGDYYFEKYSRLGHPSSTTPLGVDALLSAHQDYVDRTSSRGAFTSFIFHVPWVDRPERFGAIRELVHRLQEDDRVWLASSAEIATWMKGNPDIVPTVTSHFDAEPAW